MPHQCTDCGRTFEDGSKEMLSGCPDCGGNKFQFIPADAVDEPVEANSPGEPPSRGSSAGAVSKAATTVRDWVGGGSDDEGREPPSGESTPGEWPKSGTEDYETPAEKASQRPTDDETTEPTEPAAGSSTPAGPSDASTASSDTTTDDGTIQARTAEDEDTAQASARSDVVSPDELPEGTAAPPADSPADGSSAPRTDPPTSRTETTAVDDTPTGGRREPSTGDTSADEGPAPSGADVPREDRHEAADPADTQIEDRPDLDELREELNQQFESIKILNPGQYELNLMELYDREEYIISLREDGRYVIDVPDSWRGDD